METDPYDGCGQSVIWATSPNDPFYPACNVHDAAYVNGGTADDLKTANAEFLRRCLALAGDSGYLHVKAYLYYGIVVMAGRFFWRYHDTTALK